MRILFVGLLLSVLISNQTMDWFDMLCIDAEQIELKNFNETETEDSKEQEETKDRLSASFHYISTLNNQLHALHINEYLLLSWYHFEIVTPPPELA